MAITARSSMQLVVYLCMAISCLKVLAFETSRHSFYPNPTRHHAAPLLLNAAAVQEVVRSLPHEDESWFVKTEQFCKPFPQVKPYLEQHRTWVDKLRENGYCVTSGYRVDADGKPGGGGLMIFAALNYDVAKELVLQDPLVANGCVDWQLNGWIGEVGDLELR